MALFVGHLTRSLGGAALAAMVAHFLMAAIPNNLYSLNLTQTTVALLALAAVTILVVAHHRTQGQFLTQTQEEMVLIGAFGLFWLALLVTLRVIRQRGGEFAGHDVPPGGYRQTVAKPVGKAGGGKARQEWAGYGYGYQPAYTVEEYEYW